MDFHQVKASSINYQNIKEKRETTKPLAGWDLNLPSTTVEQISRVTDRETLIFKNVATARTVKGDSANRADEREIETEGLLTFKAR